MFDRSWSLELLIYANDNIEEMFRVPIIQNKKRLENVCLPKTVFSSLFTGLSFFNVYSEITV